jgi:hypothetical protein
MGLGQALQSLDHGIEQNAQNARSLGLERRPEFCLGAAALLGDRLKRQEQRAVGEIGPSDDVLDAFRISGRAASNSTSS